VFLLHGHFLGVDGLIDADGLQNKMGRGGGQKNKSLPRCPPLVPASNGPQAPDTRLALGAQLGHSRGGWRSPWSPQSPLAPAGPGWPLGAGFAAWHWLCPVVAPACTH
jgi:hypothetical protein